MGCSASKLEDEEAVKLCRERRNFVKQAVEQRTRFAAGHRAYIQSLRQVSDALRGYVERDDHHHDFFSDSCSTPPFTPVKRLSSSPEIIGIPCKSFTPAMEATHESSRKMIHCLRAGGNPAAVMVEERPPSPETARVSTHYYPSEHYSIDGFFSMQSPPMATGSSFFSSASPPRRTSIPPPSPQNPQWDFFWNPFSSLDTYGYASQSSPERRTMMAAEEDELAGLRQIREEEGIPELEEEELPKPVNFDERRKKVVEAAVDLPAELNQARAVDHSTPETKQQVREFEFHAADGVKAAVAAAAAGVEAVGAWPPELAEVEAAEETPGFTVYLNCRPTSMAEVMRDIEHQFIRIHDSAREVALMLEVGKAQRSSSNELTAAKMLNPVALFRSASFRSSSSLPSRFLPASSAARDDGGDDSGSDVSDESCMISGSHQSTLERLFAWEKKLYEEVKSGERVRMAYERKRMQLRKQDINGEDPSVVDRTRIAVRDLQTQLKVSIHSVEAISKRIEKLRDEELCPQLLELIQGMSRMWRTVADCHQIQKAAIDGAKHLLATAPKLAAAPPPLSRPAARLEAELRNWRSCLRVWVDAQGCYVRSLAGWLLRCARSPEEEDDAQMEGRSPLSPPRSSGAPPVFGLCMKWSKALDGVSEERALEGLDFFASGIYTVAGQQREAAAEAARRRRDTAAPPAEEEEEPEVGRWSAPEKMAELAVRVLFAGMSVAVSALAEFAAASRDAYEELQRRFPVAAAGGGAAT